VADPPDAVLKFEVPEEVTNVLTNRLVHTTTCFGPVYWPSSGCIINLISSYTIYAGVLWGGSDLVPPRVPPHILYSYLLSL